MYQILLSLHVLFAIFWFGSVLFSDLVVIPAVQSMPAEAQNKFMDAVTPRLNRALIPAGALTILSGVAVGLVTGVLGALNTPYGHDWLAAFGIAVLTYLWGLLVITPAIEKLRGLPLDSPDLLVATRRVQILALLELIGFTVVFALMMMMRFGG